MNDNYVPRETWKNPIPIIKIYPTTIIALGLGACTGHALSTQHYLFLIPTLLYMWMIIHHEKTELDRVKNCATFFSITMMIACAYWYGLSLILIPLLVICKYGTRTLFWTRK